MIQLTSTLVLRNLTPLEASEPFLLPPELRETQFPLLDPSWCWIVEHSGDPIALVVTSPTHGILFIWRVLSTASAKRFVTWFLAALPRILENARVRGCVGYATFLHDSRPEESQLARIIQRSGGLLEPFVGSMAAGIIPFEGSEKCLLPLSSPQSPPP